MKNKFKFTLQLNDNDHSKLMGAAKDGDIKSIKVKIEASHSGIVNANSFFYTPAGMKAGVKSFVEPYNKPVMVAHDRDADAVGRVLKAKYVDYPEVVSDVKDIKDPVDGVDTIVTFTKKNKDFKKKGYKGLGHVELVAEITDSEAIEKVMDKRYLTVSIGGGVDKAVCSICGTDKMAQDDADHEDRCNHWRGETYDGEKAFLIGGKMEFDEVSYVNTPADKNAVSEVINDEASQEIFSNGKFEILDFEVEEKTGVNKLKKKLKDILADKGIVSDTLKALGLTSFALEDEQYGKLRKTSYLFANDKAIPVNDKAHVIAAYEILTDAEDSKDLDEAKEVLDRKFANLFGKDISVEDAKAELLDSVKTEDEVTDAKADAADVEIDYDKLADSVADKVTEAVVGQLKDSFTVNDSFLGQRNEILEAEVTGLEKEIDALTDKYKSAMIGQILTKEDKLEDADYKGKLEARTLDSLNDKLEDLGLTAKQELDTSKEEVKDDASDEDGIEDTSVNIEDASDESGDLSDEDGSVEDNIEDDADDVSLTVDQVTTEYRNIFKKQGFKAARDYLKDLEDKKQLPDNFTFA